MKVIDLLNKIANGEEVPEEIKYKGTSYEYKEGVDYSNLSGDYLLSTECVSKEFLNSEVEIIEEDKRIEEITKWGKGALEEIQTKKDYKISSLQKYIEILMVTQNQIIDRLNELKKGE